MGTTLTEWTMTEMTLAAISSEDTLTLCYTDELSNAISWGKVEQADRETLSANW